MLIKHYQCQWQEMETVLTAANNQKKKPIRLFYYELKNHYRYV